MSYCGIRVCKWNPQIVSGIRKLWVESAFYLRIPFTYMNICISVLIQIFDAQCGHQQIQSELLSWSTASWNTKTFDLNSCP